MTFSNLQNRLTVFLILQVNYSLCLSQSLKSISTEIELNTEAVQTFMDQLSLGPLQDSEVAFILDDTESVNNDVDLLIKSFAKPITLFLSYEDTLDESTILNEACIIVLPNLSPNSSLLVSPPDFLSAKSFIILNVDFETKPKHYFTSQLLAESKRATVIQPLAKTRQKIPSDGKDRFNIYQDEGFSQNGNRQKTSTGGTNIFKIYLDEGFSKDGNRSQKIDVWDSNSFQTLDSVLVEKWNSLGGAVLELASDYDDKPLIFETSTGEISGLCIMILNELAEQMDFKYTTQFVAPDDEWGSLENGSWNGMLGQLYRREKNLTLNYFTVTYDRVRDFDFSTSYYNEGFGFAMKIPSPLPRWMSLVFPFSLEVWMGIGVALVVTSIISYAYRRSFHLEDPHLFTTSCLLLIKSLLKQSTHDTKIATNFNSIVCTTWWFFSFIMAVSYTCNFIAVLTVTKFPPRISENKQLADSDTRIVMLDYGEFVPEALKKSEDKILKKLGMKLDLVPFLPESPNYNYETTAEMVLNGTHAHTETYSYLKLLYAATFNVEDQVYFMAEQVYYGNLAFFFPKRTPWKHKFDETISRLVECGITNKWYDDIMKQEMGNVIEKQNGGILALSVDHFQGAFYILGICLAVSFLLFLAEVFKVLPN